MGFGVEETGPSPPPVGPTREGPEDPSGTGDTCVEPEEVSPWSVGRGGPWGLRDCPRQLRKELGPYVEGTQTGPLGEGVSGVRIVVGVEKGTGGDDGGEGERRKETSGGEGTTEGPKGGREGNDRGS